MPGDTITATAPAAGGESTKFTRLQLMRYSLSRTGAVQLDEQTCFEAQINPAEFSHSFGIQYSKTKAQGSPGEEPKFSGMDEERVSFSIVLDGTGVVPPVNKQPPDVKSQLAQLTKVVYEYLDIKSEPPYVRVLWGTLIFFGRLESLRSQYTLFKPSGDPLRAKVEMSFVGAMSKEERSRVTSRISTSTRNVTVIEGRFARRAVRGRLRRLIWLHEGGALQRPDRLPQHPARHGAEVPTARATGLNSMADSPLLGSIGVVTLSVLVGGQRLAQSDDLIAVTVQRAANSVPSARLVFNDGDMPERTFPISDADDFKPGAQLTIKAGATGSRRRRCSRASSCATACASWAATRPGWWWTAATPLSR